jgi:hypothetical protein
VAADLRAAWLFVRCWGSRPLATGAVLTVAAWWVVPIQPVTVPARSGVASLLWPLVPVLVAGALPSAALTAYGDLEATTARPRLGLRIRALGLYWVVVLAASVPGGRFDGAVVLRNSAGLVGVALLAALLVPTSLSWLPVTLIPMSMWLLGQDADRATARWAVLLAAGGSISAAVTCSALALIGSVGYLVCPAPRSSRGI